ncbi:hypothetical protein AAHA92_03773 [Salvia divinorum]|uniref:Cytochrome P450 n=1 Tax=Salvia divinorum TaxID=28513 RepID=A0ABD1HX22_SALDI
MVTLMQTGQDKAADFSIDRENIKTLILDVFAAGTDTSSIVLEWTMTELLRNPKILQKLQKEVREIVKQGNDIKDDDLEKMHYLKAVIKETFRYFPPIPLLLPRLAADDLKMKGYDVTEGTVAMVNVWAIGRDPASWHEPDIFKPERFVGSTIDFKGFDFELIPFGAGRKEMDMSEKPGITIHRAVSLLAVATKAA